MTVPTPSLPEVARGRFFALAPDPMAVLDAEGLLVCANPAFEALVGAAAAAPGQPLRALLTDTDACLLDAALAAPAAAPQRFEARALRHDGQQSLLAWTLAHEAGLVYAWAHDVTARRALAREAARREREMREAQRLAAVGSFEVALATGAVYWSAEMYRIFGVDPGTPITVETVFGLTHPEDRPAAEAIIGAGLAGELQEADFEHRLIRPDGVERRFRLRAAFVKDAAGQVARFIGAGQDVTEKRAAEALLQAQLRELERANAHKDQFLSILSHELRTPINAIMGFGSILEDGLAGPLNEPQARWVSRILEGSESMLALVNDLLDMSRVQAGKFALEPQPVDLAALLGATCAQAEAACARTGHALTCEPAGPLPALRADPQRVAQVVTNLVGNACKYQPGGGPIHLRARAGDGHVRVEVQDRGIGIAPADQLRVFEPFTQVDMSDTRGAGGVGLGLSIARALVEAHGGTIGLDSRPGAGSTFWFTLPTEP